MCNTTTTDVKFDFACDGVTDDAIALAELFRRAFLRERIGGSRKDDRAITEVRRVSENKIP
jgi:hypothetical protein